MPRQKHQAVEPDIIPPAPCEYWVLLLKEGRLKSAMSEPRIENEVNEENANAANMVKYCSKENKLTKLTKLTKPGKIRILVSSVVLLVNWKPRGNNPAFLQCSGQDADDSRKCHGRKYVPQIIRSEDKIQAE